MLFFPKSLPVFQTKRLTLRSMSLGDVDALFRIYGDAEVMRYTSDEVVPDLKTVVMMLQSVNNLFAAKKSLEWGIVVTKTNILVGTCGFHSFQPTEKSAEVGCILDRRVWGQGYMREALLQLMGYARSQLGLQLLYADIDSQNNRSIKLFQSLGFSRKNNSIYSKIMS